MSRSIYCKRLPKELIDEENAAKYFKEFGRIRQLIHIPPGGACLVEYETPEEARRALHESGFYKGKTFIVQSGAAAEREKNRSADPSVQAELDMMSGGGKLPSRQLQPSAPVPQKSSAPAPRPALPLFQPGMLKKSLPTSSSDMMPPPAAQPPSSPVMIHKMSVPELQKLIASPAFSTEQRYRCLDARDKLTRLHLAQTTDITKTKTTKGSCPDMCPEKERLMRETKHQINSFEMVTGSRHQIDHALAVKQYSRSSADQEMSLPRELRSESVLRMTMMYLLHEIADLCDTSNVGVSDWFHFLWDRTRSIRKDIAQQELGCQGSVRLVEQCARFHIHCAGRLVAEEPQVFDQKINTENLTKCLQSLKYMYHDLRLKGEQCPNEPEFRAYIILLNLQDSNFLWEVKQLPVHIQQSPEVRFGIDVFKALEQNNYVRFFKLVRKTTYMNACILVRYFTQVRARALATIVKAYSIKAGVPLSLSSLAYSLAFEDDQSASQFFEYYGLNCDEERVYVDRTTFYFPDLPFLMDRAINIVEQKRLISVGAAIAGGEEHLAPKSIFQNHVPENSFDARGFLKTSADERLNISVEESQVDDEQVDEDEEYNDEMQDNDDDYQRREDEEQEDGEYMEEENYEDDEMNQDYDDDREDDEEDDDEDEDDSDEQEMINDVVDSDHVFKKPSPVASPSFRGSQGFGSKSTGTSFKFQIDKLLPELPSSGFSFAQQLPSTPFMANGKMTTPTPTRTPSSNSSPFGTPKSPLRTQTNNHQSSPFSFNQSAPPPPSIGFSFTKALSNASSPSPSIPPSSPKTMKPKTPTPVDGILSEADELQRKADVLLLAGPQSERMLREVCAEEVRRTAKEMLNKYAKQQAECNKCADSIVSDVVQELLVEVHREECLEYHVGVYARQKLLKRAFSGWRKRSTANRVARDRTQMTPLWMPTVPLEKQMVELESNHQQGTLGDLARYRLGEPKGVKLVATHTEKLDIAKQIATGLAQRLPQQKQILFNLVISVPGEDEGAFGCCSYLKRWLRENIEGTSEKQSKQPLILKELHVNAFQSVAICGKLVVGEELTQEEDGMRLSNAEEENLDGILFYASEKDRNQRRRPMTNKNRFKALMEKFRRKSSIPVVVFNLDDYREEEQIMSDLGMDVDRVGAVLVDARTEKKAIRESLREGISFLTENYTLPNERLRSMQLINLVTSTVGETLWMRLAINSTVNAATDEILRHSETVAEIYNEAIERVIRICGSDYAACVDVPRELQGFVRRSAAEAVANNYAHFPKDWRSSKRQETIRGFLRSLKLDRFPSVKILPSGQFDEGGAALQRYVMALFGAQPVIRNVLFQMVETLNQEEGSSWIRPLQVLTKQLFLERLREAREDLPAVVVYDERQFAEYQDTPWWLQSTVLKRRIEIEAEQEKREAPEEKKRRVTREFEGAAAAGGVVSGLDDILKRATECVQRAERITSNFKQNKDALQTISSKYDDRLSRLMMCQQMNNQGGARSGPAMEF